MPVQAATGRGLRVPEDQAGVGAMSGGLRQRGGSKGAAGDSAFTNQTSESETETETESEIVEEAGARAKLASAAAAEPSRQPGRICRDQPHRFGQGITTRRHRPDQGSQLALRFQQHIRLFCRLSRGNRPDAQGISLPADPAALTRKLSGSGQNLSGYSQSGRAPFRVHRRSVSIIPQ